ncbi:M4 family metallopeptidase [Chryseolinea sp. T2]|uniref:M4 family metallopeptidase n=1 Tax=Chryseolinea sp. T2 TaxID=3129255 RepID=UPI003076F421
MNSYLKATVAACMAFALNQSLFAQQTFDSKKHKQTHVNPSPLKAKKITPPSASSAGRSQLTQRYLSQQPNWASPNLQRSGMTIRYATGTGLPSFIQSGRKAVTARSGQQSDARVASYSFLEELKETLKVKNPQEEFSIRSLHIDAANRTHVRMEQLYRGVPVYGSEVMVHLGREEDTFNGQYRIIREDLEVSPALSKAEAIQRANTHLGKGKGLRTLSEFEKQLVMFEDPQAELCIYQETGIVTSDVLAYHVTVCPTVSQRWEYFVDATTGAVLHKYENICSADGPRTATGADLNGVTRTVQTYQFGTGYIMLDVSRSMYKAAQSTLPDDPVGGIITVDMNNTFGDNQTIRRVASANNQWTTSTAVKALSAHYNAGLAYEYYLTKHGRQSIDGAGGTIISIVNVPDEDGEGLDNAFWNGKAMFYGNGDVALKPTSAGIDVAGHEMTHGVVQTTANLEYQGESGAINESMADIFGAMIDPDGDWLIGEDVVRLAAYPSGAMRSLSDPHNGATQFGMPGFQPKHVSEQYQGTSDNGGVHINSGIANHAFYKYATAITRTKAATVYYKALDDYLTKSSQFIDLRLAVIQAATDLYGAGSPEVVQAGVAFDEVGITNGQGGNYEESLPINPGTEFLLIYNTAQTDPNTLYRTPVAASGSIEDLTTTDFISRPSVTDQGDVAVFVASDNTIHAIKTLPGSDAIETVIEDTPMWSNVVVSKGGSKLAAVSTDQDAIIYVYDFGQQEWSQFQLYNPTYSDGVVSAGPVYADALEFDYSGQFLVYDCFNRIDNETGDDIEYWDVNFIHVWDNDAGDFADGTIEKLFASLPDGVSIGNPSFAKNSPMILAFDYVDETDDSYAIVGCNIETNEVDVIVENNSLGWPSFNKTDDRLAFTGWSETTNDYSTGYVSLNADKISGNGQVVGLYGSTKWPVFYATGEREIGDEVVTDIPEQPNEEQVLSCYPNTFERELTIDINDPTLTGGTVQMFNIAGQSVLNRTVGQTQNSKLVLDVEQLAPGYYFLRLSGTRKAGCKVVKR